MSPHTTEVKEFLQEYGRALDDRDAALFIGAGLSIPAGYKSWPGLLKDVAEEMGLAIERETDLVALAQYHLNERRARSRLNQLLVDEYGEEHEVTENHRLIAQLPVETVWTTNYDRLLEKAYALCGKRTDVKVAPENLAITVRGRDVTIHKMHGCITRAHEAVITKDDYEMYGVTREAFTTALKGDLVSKTFCFLGFSFTDPNIDYLLSRIRVLLGQNPRQHFCMMRWPEQPKGGPEQQAEHDYEMRRLKLRVADLQRYGIQAVMIQDYGEITEVLRELNRRAHRNTVFVSGSAYSYEPLGQVRVEHLASLLGSELIRYGYNVISGFGLGIGSALLEGAMQEVYRTPSAVLGDRVVMRPFPLLAPDHPERASMFRQYRRDMVSQAGAVVFLCGNRKDASTGAAQNAPGVREEYDIAQELGKVPVPVGITGSAAKDIWTEVIAAPSGFLARDDVRRDMEVLGREGATDEEVVSACVRILKRNADA